MTKSLAWNSSTLHNVVSRLGRDPRRDYEYIINASLPRSKPVTSSRIRLFAALAFVLPVAALVASPAMATTKSKAHHTPIHKVSAHKVSHKTKTHAAS
jgi:hypothetical protein